MSPWGAVAATGVVIAIATLILGLYVAEVSELKRWRWWHRPLVASLGAVAGALFIAAAWMAVEVPR